MSVRFIDGRIELAGACPLEDAEALVGAIIEHSAAPIDLSGCSALHTAVVQVILAARSEIAAMPADPFLRTHVLPGVRRALDRQP
jgi:hypothetical protein